VADPRNRSDIVVPGIFRNKTGTLALGMLYVDNRGIAQVPGSAGLSSV